MERDIRSMDPEVVSVTTTEADGAVTAQEAVRVPLRDEFSVEEISTHEVLADE